jgi:ribosomal protein L13E
MKATIKKNGKERKSRGYSIKEIVDAKIEPQELPKLGIRIDPRRKTVYPKNIKNLEELKKLLKKPKPYEKQKKK